MDCTEHCAALGYSCGSFYCIYYDKQLDYMPMPDGFKIQKCHDCVKDTNKQRMKQLLVYVKDLLYSFQLYDKKIQKDINNINILYKIIQKNEQK